MSTAVPFDYLHSNTSSFAPTNDNLYAYKFGMQKGLPWFTLAGQSVAVFAGKGAPRVTSLDGKAGTGVVSFLQLPPSLPSRTKRF